MIERVRQLMERAYRLPAKIVLLVNLAIAVFIALSHGGALLIARTQQLPGFEFVQSVARMSLPAAAFLILSSLTALAVPAWRARVLWLHGIVLFAAGLAMLFWGCTVLFNGMHFPNSAWSPGFFSALVGYAAFVFCAFTLPPLWRARPFWFHLPTCMLLVAMVVDLGVFLRFAYDFGTMIGAGGSVAQ